MKNMMRMLAWTFPAALLAGGWPLSPARAAWTAPVVKPAGATEALVWQKTTRYWVRVRTPAGNWVESFDGLAGRKQACSAFSPPRQLGDWCYDPVAEEKEEVIDPRNGTVLRSHDAPAYRFAIYCARRAADVDAGNVVNGMVDEAVDPGRCGK